MLELRDVHVEIASAQVLRGLNLQVAKGQMVGLVGRNGAGKTSSLRSIMGHLTPRMSNTMPRDTKPLAMAMVSMNCIHEGRA